MKVIKKYPGAFVHSRAYVAGDVTLGEGANIWCGACIRGDFAPVVIGKNSNVQDNATVHVGYGVPTVLGDNVTVGHNAVVHGCTVGNNVVVGMGSILLDGAKIGDNCIIGAGTLIPGKKEILEGSLVFGNPYRIVRALSQEEKEGIVRNAEEYVHLAAAFAAEGEGSDKRIL